MTSPQENAYLQQIEKIKTEKETLHPVPEIGEIVIWYNGGIKSDENQTAAIVTRVDRPGVVQLAILRPQAAVLHKGGVRYDAIVSDAERRNQTVIANGTWGLRDSQQIQPRHKKAWKEYCEEKIGNIQAALEKYQAERAAATQVAAPQAP